VGRPAVRRLRADVGRGVPSISFPNLRGGRFCAGCQDYSYAGHISTDAFLCYRCHPADVRKTPSAKRARSCSSAGSLESLGRGRSVGRV